MNSGVVTTSEVARSASQPTPRARIGAVSYLNTLPLVAGLESTQDIELHLAAPSRLSAMLHEGEVDVALAPVIESQRAPSPVALLPVGMIGSDGETLTVRLFSKRPMAETTRVFADVESRTSVALSKIILKERFDATPEFVEFDAREGVARPSAGGAAMVETPETMLLIGDKVVRAAPDAASYPHQLDLGQAWRDLTGLPFVYAIWMCLADRFDDPAVRVASALLDRQRRHNRTRMDWLVTKNASEHAWPVDLARDYLGEHLRYEVTSDDRTAIDTFLDAAHRVGALQTRTPTRWGSD